MNKVKELCTEFLIKGLDIFISTHENKRMDKFQVPAYNFIGRRPSKVTKHHEVELESYELQQLFTKRLHYKLPKVINAKV